MCSPVSEQAAGIRLEVRVTPRAGANRIGEVRNGRLLVKVTAPPEDGKANQAVIKLLAKAWRLPASSFEVIAGATSREKSLLIHGAVPADITLPE